MTRPVPALLGYQAWAGLADSVGDGHARIPPWRERLAAAAPGP